MNIEKMNIERIPVMLCVDKLTDKVSHIDVGTEYCSPSILNYLGLSDKYVAKSQCGDKSYKHVCQTLSKDEIDKLVEYMKK